jgi:hypothetical protein
MRGKGPSVRMVRIDFRIRSPAPRSSAAVQESARLHLALRSLAVCQKLTAIRVTAFR